MPFLPLLITLVVCKLLFAGPAARAPGCLNTVSPSLSLSLSLSLPRSSSVSLLLFCCSHAWRCEMKSGQQQHSFNLPQSLPCRRDFLSLSSADASEGKNAHSHTDPPYTLTLSHTHTQPTANLFSEMKLSPSVFPPSVLLSGGVSPMQQWFQLW